VRLIAKSKLKNDRVLEEMVKDLPEERIDILARLKIGSRDVHCT